MIYGNSIGTEIDRTFIIQDAYGNELVATVTNRQVVFDATPNDIRIGKVAATQNGVTVGEKEIPVCHVSEGRARISPGKDLVVNLYSSLADYTRFQAIVCEYNTSLNDSVSGIMVAINDGVYDVNSTTKKASVSVSADKQSINLGITNETDDYLVIRYFTYKEIY